MQYGSIGGHHRAEAIGQVSDGVSAAFPHGDSPLTSHHSVSENVGPIVESALRRASQHGQPGVGTCSK